MNVQQIRTCVRTAVRVLTHAALTRVYVRPVRMGRYVTQVDILTYLHPLHLKYSQVSH